MKILLTGLPKSGKTTLLTNLIESAQKKHGMVAREEVRDGRRVGFNILNRNGDQVVLATTDRETNFPVGRFFVDVVALDNFSANLLDFSYEDLLYIDEIGQMQLYSESFKELIESYLNSDNDYVGTISAVHDHPFIQKIRSRQDVLFCIVTPENRQELHVALSAAVANRQLFNRLSPSQRLIALDLAKHYVIEDQYISLKKLFHNALRYVVEEKIAKNGSHSYTVNGDHAKHSVYINGEVLQCDCDFFNGRGQFKNFGNQCSHIQAVILMPS